jgi:predicted nucleic acid-binding protein
MRLVVADTRPVRYLIAIEQIDLLPRLFGSVAVPSVVAEELLHPSAPRSVRAWMGRPPGRFHVRHGYDDEHSDLEGLDRGERAAIVLGVALKADLMLVDDRRGAAVALKKGFPVLGTLGVLDLAAEQGHVNLNDALDRLRRTNFRYRPELFDVLIRKHSRGGSRGSHE